VRRSVAEPSDLAYSMAYAPTRTPSEELVRVAEVRWRIKEGFAQLKGEIGLDQYEVRRWEGWHRFMTLCLLAHAYRVVLRLRARVPDAVPAGALLPLTVPEVRRLVLALAGAAAAASDGAAAA
jgi:SRSO17 transposase